MGCCNPGKWLKSRLNGFADGFLMYPDTAKQSIPIESKTLK
jgi:hypothetical protein